VLLNVAQQLLNFDLIASNVDLKLLWQSDVATQIQTENKRNHSKKKEDQRVF